MHEEAVKIYEGLGEEKEAISRFFKWRYRKARDRVWTIKKLYAFAMFLPMFLQIGRAYFDELVYVDTHAGPGLAKVGNGELDLALGSPLIALLWPKIIASNVSQFQGISEGFNKLLFIEMDSQTARILNMIISKLDVDQDKIKIERADSNNILGRGREYTKTFLNVEEDSLYLIFIDPFGELESQIRYSKLERFVNDHPKVDLVINLQSGSLARGLSAIGNIDTFKGEIERLFGDAYQDPEVQDLSIPHIIGGRRPTKDLVREDLVKLYEHVLRTRWDYKQVYSLPVEYREETELYHLVFATRSPGQKGAWLNEHRRYLNKTLPMSYEKFKVLWGIARGKQKALVTPRYEGLERYM